MKISVQSLFDDYEENAVSLNRDADAERILEKTRAKLPGVKRKRPLGRPGRRGKLYHAGHAPL